MSYAVKAFPRPAGESGMDLRDFFAAAALAGMIKDRYAGQGGSQSGDTHAKYAENAYEFADAMMIERQRR